MAAEKTHPDYGEPFSRQLLKLVLGRNVGKLKVIPQNVYFASDVSLHGAILDAYLEEEDEGATVYDVEPEKDDHEEAVRAIPRRMRFYRAKIDGRGLKAGENYGKLKNLVEIMITPFDPFGMGRMRYTVRNSCVEEPSMCYDDGAVMIFLNAKGRPDGETRELCEFLRYAENSTLENATSEELKTLHWMVEGVRHDEEVSLRYMRLWESEESIRRKALEEGQAIERANTDKERARAEAEKNRAEAAETRAEAEKTRAEKEKTRADQAERELEELRKLLNKTS